MKTEIKATTIVTCDICKDPRKSRASRPSVILKRDALDWNNAPCADASVSLDLCDDCSAAVARAINELGVTRGIQLSQDGNMRCATFHDFTNLQKSIAGFGSDDSGAIADLMKQAQTPPQP